MAEAALSAATRRRASGHARLGMAIFLGTWVMLFAALFLAYAVVRAQADVWPPPSVPRLPRALPGLGTLLLVASSLILRRGITRASADGRRLARALATAAGLGVLFVGLQALVWRDVLSVGLGPATGTYASVFFALTIFHALHVACGLGLLAAMAARAAAGRATAGSDGVWLAALFWDFVTIVWVAIYGTVFWL